MKKFVLAAPLMLLVACSANKNIKTELYNELLSKKPQYSEFALEEISKLKPQINPPIKIAVSQPTGNEGWSSEVIQEIESW